MEYAPLVTKIFLIVLVVKELIESYLASRNKHYIQSHQDKVPEDFEQQISLEEHKKAAAYSISKINTSQFFNLISVAVLIVWTLGGGLNALDHLVRQFSLGPIQTSVGFVLLFGLISFFLSLPQSLYTTFVLEEKFGFNKTDGKTFITDIFKGLFLSALIGIPMLLALFWIIQKLGDYWWIYAWGLVVGFQFFIMWAYPAFIAPLFNKFYPLEEGETKKRVEQLLERIGFKSQGLFVMDASKRSSHGNAYFTGFGKNKRIVFFDNLIKTLAPDEIEAVLAHELGHFKRKHIVKNMIKSLIITFIGFAILGFLYTWEPFYAGHGVKTPSAHTGLILFMLVSGVYTFFLTPLMAWGSRKYEFEADEFAAQHSEASKLISALVKLYKDNASTLTPDPLFSRYYHSHPPASVRVQHLKEMKN